MRKLFFVMAMVCLSNVAFAKLIRIDIPFNHALKPDDIIITYYAFSAKQRNVECTISPYTQTTATYALNMEPKTTALPTIFSTENNTDGHYTHVEESGYLRFESDAKTTVSCRYIVG